MENGCFGITFEKKYYRIQNGDGTATYIKRSLAPEEWLLDIKGETIVPRLVPERLKNEVAAIAFVRRHTTLPVPTVRCTFEDKGCSYVVLDEVPGISVSSLPADKQVVAIPAVERAIEVMRAVTATAMGGFAGTVCLPYRVDLALSKQPGARQHAPLEFRDTVPHELVLCHGDLSQSNVFVDPDTLEVTGIIDWEYAGFYPREFEGMFYKRPGPSAAMEGEEDDVPQLLRIVDECRKD
ncbi:kinase-like protein [Artomyces pyxidatus]|uniref:Kinase-like protein n=1 Tax=Artomyces pyxidatus TaxID=48021 RepID=A0ACB8SLW4_9AGAM|nr:kinase-like protein [Artomyces pyxidatus]